MSAGKEKKCGEIRKRFVDRRHRLYWLSNGIGNDYPTHDGTRVRDYTHIVDLAKGHLIAQKYAETH